VYHLHKHTTLESHQHPLVDNRLHRLLSSGVRNERGKRFQLIPVLPGFPFVYRHTGKYKSTCLSLPQVIANSQALFVIMTLIAVLRSIRELRKILSNPSFARESSNSKFLRSNGSALYNRGACRGPLFGYRTWDHTQSPFYSHVKFTPNVPPFLYLFYLPK